MFCSVIIPTFNRADIIAQTITCVLSQKYTDFELIIVDDGSKDMTKQVVSSFYSNGNVKYLYQENKGVCAARNFGVENARGKYILFLDDDDSVTFNWLDDFVEVLFMHSYDLVFCSINELLQDGTSRIKPAHRIKNGVQTSGNYIPGSFCISKALFLQAGGYDPVIRYGENTELSFRLQQLKPAVGFVNAANLLYKASIDGGSKNWKNKLDSTLYILEKHELIFKKNRRVKSLYYGVAALAAYKCKNSQFARALFIKSFLANPSNWKAVIRLLVSYIPALSEKKWK